MVKNMVVRNKLEVSAELTQLAVLAALILSTLIYNQKTHAVQPLSTQELAAHCSHYSDDPVGIDAVFCTHYVQGFIDGAIATDVTVMKNVVAEYEGNETFTERALRTRSPSREPSIDDASFYAEFCLSEEVSLSEVVEHVITDLANREIVEHTLLARDAVYAMLKRDYPCESQDKE